VLYVHCPSPRTFRSPGLCKLPVVVPFQTSHLQSTCLSAGHCNPFWGTKLIFASHGYAAHFGRHWLAAICSRVGRDIRICGGQSGTGTDCFLSTSVFPYQYHSTIAPYSSYIYSLLSAEGQTREAREPLKSVCSFGNGEALGRTVR